MVTDISSPDVEELAVNEAIKEEKQKVTVTNFEIRPPKKPSRKSGSGTGGGKRRRSRNSNKNSIESSEKDTTRAAADNTSSSRKRGGSGIYDVALSKDLINNQKERAEHIMLVDLERNDLSKVTVKGTVKVNESMVVESYTHVHHIVSNVKGKIKKKVSPGEIIKAVFPGGTITGCPKVRCMEILSEIEQTGRGPYTGSMGYINHDGTMDLNILIRTITKYKNNVSIRAGGGIVADSIPKRELEEARAKARGMINALMI